MPRSKRFFIFILVIMLVNASFFLAWYGLGLRIKFREFVASELGKILKGSVSISELHFSDRQLFAEGISFVAADSSLAFEVAKLRVQYNITRYVFSGFKTYRLVREIEINQPRVQYQYTYKPSVPKPPKPLILPDIADFFGSLKVSDGSVRIGITFPLKIIQNGQFEIKEELHKINLTAINKGSTHVTLDAISTNNGKLSANGNLSKGRIAFVNAELGSFKPLYVSHPDLQQVSSEISLVGKISQDSLGAKLNYEAKLQMWATQCLFAQKYPTRIPYFYAQTDGKNLSAQLSNSTFGSSNASADVKISNLGPKLNFDFAKANAYIDLSMVNPILQGYVTASMDGGGTIDQPHAILSAASEAVSIHNYTIRNVALQADFKDGEALFTLPGVQYENQILNASGSFKLANLALDAHLETHPLSTEMQPYLATADLNVYAEFLDVYPYVAATINKASFSSKQASIKGIQGKVTLVPVSLNHNYYIDAKLQGEQGFKLALVGDILDRNLLLDAELTSFFPAEIMPQPILTKLNPMFSGKIMAIMQGEALTAHSNVDVIVQEPLPFSTNLDAVGNFNLKTLEGAVHLKGRDGLMNNQPIDFSLAAIMEDKQLHLQGLRINDFLSLSGRLNLDKLDDFSFSAALSNFGYMDIVRFYPELDISLPQFQSLSLFADYNMDHNGRLEAKANLAEVDLLAITPLSVNLALSGPLSGIGVQGDVYSPTQRLIDLNGIVAVKPKLDVKMDAFFANLQLQNFILDSPVKGTIDGKAGVVFRDLLGKKPQLEFVTDLHGKAFEIGDIMVSTARIKASQFINKLQVDTLYVLSDRLFEVTGSGAIDYNAVTNEFFEGTNVLKVNVQGQLFAWLKNLTSYILESRGNSALAFTVGVFEDQFMVSNGKLEISDGYLRLQDQSEALSNINIKGTFDKNRMIIERGQVQMGEGKLLFNNIFEADNSDHFILGFLDLGIIRAIIEEPGILANIPMFTPEKTLSNIVLKGRGSRYAMIKGPFDQMKISAEVVLSNTNALFPPNTNNLLKLANSVRESTSRRNVAETVPLPFTLDVLITLGDNVNYVTYPTKLSIQSGGSLHLIYDGLTFTVGEAYFSSERGTIDIFGTVFQVEKVDITMIDSQQLLSVDGLFYKRAPDGTLISLRVTTSPDLTKSFSDRLEFSLTSDNPEDRTISQILSRLRYSGSNEPNQNNQGEQLQDEALNLISGNLDASLLTPFLSPVETYIRRKLRLDNFSINAGFIQNIYTQYSNDPAQLTGYSDMKQFSSNIAQFSSSILLNNLSVSMSKYLGRRLFLDYEFELQEATDIQKRTRLMVSHGTSIRLLLPKKYRLGYTFKYTPLDKEMSHELMLQKSFRFWGF